MNERLVDDVRQAAQTLDRVGRSILLEAALDLEQGLRKPATIRLRRAGARATPRELEALEPLLDRAKRSTLRR